LIVKVGLVLTVVLLAAAAITNPTEEDFSNVVADRLNAEYKDQLENPAFKAIAEEVTSFAAAASKNLTQRDNYWICSVFTLDLPYGKYRYFGAFTTFVPLQSDDPLKAPQP
jgi:hypothetical protein